ncbi:MAG: HDIG domain-containing metalloprotein, partial [Candidatus Cryptobacteroides sp.]
AVLFVMFIIASQVAVLTFKYFNHGWQQFIMAGLVFLSLVVTYSAFRLVDMVDDNPYLAVLCLAVGSLLTVAGYTLIFLFERVFNLLSQSRLAELCDTNNPLLREFETKAPGSFQHSLQVMNMADVAARLINANVALVRAGALYHDIGKMENPLCFIENESLSASGTYYHQGLSPAESARNIIRHVPDGVRIAGQHNIPAPIVDFIRSHHGTSCTGFFYSKYINQGGDPAEASSFFYDGIKPKTREQVIVMICDTLEAASRTLKDNSPETFDRFVEDMVSMKLKAGQLDDAEITIHELNVVKDGLKSYLSQLYHERIAYPGQKQ